MKKLFLIFGLFSALTVSPAFAHEDHGKSQFGGIVAEAGLAQFEVVAKDGKLTVHVSNHGVPIPTAGATGKVTVLAGASKSEIELKPLGDNRLQGTGTLAAGAKLLISVQLAGQKPLQARAEVK